MDAARIAFCLVLVGGILAVSIPDRWAWSAQQIATFGLTAIAIWGERPRFDRLHVLLAGAAAWGLVQVAVGSTADAGRTLDQASRWFTWLAAAWLGSRLPPERVLRPFVLFVAAVCAAAILGEFLTPGKLLFLFPTQYASQVMGPFEHPNQFAAFVELGAPAALAVYGAGSAGPILAALMVVSVIVSGSYGGLAALAAGGAAALFALWRRNVVSASDWRALAGKLAVCGLVFGLVTGWETVARKASSRPLSAVERALLTQSTIEMARERPGLGWGLGTWPAAYPAFAKFDTGHFDNQAHNDWAQWAAEGGVPFFALMLAIAAALAGPAWRTIYGLGVLSVLAHCLVEYHFQQRPAFGALFFAFAGLVHRAGSTPAEPRR